MYSYKKTKKQSFLASLLLHLLLFSGVGLYIDFMPPNIRQGEKESTFITSYLYQSDQLETIQGVKKQRIITKETEPREKKSQRSNRNSLNKNNLLQNNSVNSNASPSKQDATSAPSAQTQSSSNGEQIKGLLSLLHAAIQDKQQYPLSALQMGRQGRVTLGFRLYPDGSISELRLIKSCGTGSLDSAALTAVRLAMPFKQVDVYLKVPQDFTIEVVFALDEEN